MVVEHYRKPMEVISSPKILRPAEKDAEPVLLVHCLDGSLFPANFQGEEICLYSLLELS